MHEEVSDYKQNQKDIDAQATKAILGAEKNWNSKEKSVKIGHATSRSYEEVLDAEDQRKDQGVESGRC